MHTVTKEKSDTAELLSKVEHLEDTLKVMSERVMALEKRLQSIDIQSSQLLLLIKVDYLQNSDEDAQSSFYDTLLEFTSSGIKIKVGFGDPLLVS